MYCTSTQMKKPSCACLRIYERKEKDTMLKSFVTLIITLIVGVVFMAIGNDFFNGFTDIKIFPFTDIHVQLQRNIVIIWQISQLIKYHNLL